jgi:hypothetical protein
MHFTESTRSGGTRPWALARSTVLAGGMLASSLIGGATVATPTFAQAVVNNPPVAPHSIFAFPQRDFVSASGWAQGQTVTVQVLHPDGTVRSTLSGLLPKDDPSTPGFDGIVEVNHPGGYCWDTVTPDIRWGDKVRIVVDATGATDEITVQNVTAKRPVQTAPDTIQVHGTFDPALDTASLEQRMVADPKNLFEKNGRRTLRATVAAGSDGTMTIDSPGNWTATYSGLSATDVQRALDSESRILWLGANPAAGVDNTIYENGAAAVAGPSAPCTAPLEKLAPPPGSELVPPTTPTNLVASPTGDSVTLTWTASTDNVGVVDYGILRSDSTGALVPVATVQLPSGDAPAPTTFTDSGLIAGSYTYAVDAGDAVGNRSPASSPGVSVTVGATAPVTVNDPPTTPHSLIAFPQRDFISATGYTPGVAYTFEVIRNNATVAKSTPIVADSTGLAEVNHPGGACWNVVSPNIQPGDIVRITDPNGVAEQTTVSGVSAERPIVTAIDSVTGGGTIQIHGTAQDALGKPLPLDQIEQRLVARNDLFDINGRRTIRAGAGLDGTLAYDAAGSTKWTATYTLQTPNDLARAVGGTSTSGTDFGGAESRILWLGRDAGATGVELTIYENGDAILGGPASGLTGCVGAPAETPAPGASLPATVPTFSQTATGGTSASQTVTLTNNGGAPLHIGRAYLAGLNPSDFALTATGVDGATVAPGASVNVSVAFKPQTAGNKQAFLAFQDDAANTTQQYLALAGSTPPSSIPTATAPIQSLAALAAGKDLVVNQPLGNSTIAVDLRWTGTGSRSELQMATGNNTNQLGAFTPVTLTPDTATSTTVNLKMGTTTGTAYQFQVRSCNGTTCGTWVQGPKFTLLPADEANMPATAWKGTWTAAPLTGAYGGSVKWAAGSANATIVQTSFTVSGNAAWVSTLGPDRGLAQVQVDNEKPQVIDMYAPTETPAQIVWARDALPVGNHTVTVTVLGKRSTLNPAPCNTGTKCARVDIDAAVMIR